jgi:succinyl-CoA synthetase alpha subunit/GNAT superfamily N-acetyltransferase
LTGPGQADGSGRSYALLADGTTLTIRPAGPDDYEAVRRLHEAMSPENLYFRFFSASRVSAEREARRVCAEDRPGMVALLGLLGGELAGVASYELAPDETSAEVALAVADGMHRRGVATLLLEHLVSVARAGGVQTFTAEVLADNHAVLHVLADSGLALRRRFSSGVVDMSMPIPRLAALGEASAYLEAVAGRDSRADVASLEPLLEPRSVAVVGAGRRPGSAGRTILLNIRDGGFAGALYAVSPQGGIEGIRYVPSVAELPEAPDLAVVTVPAAQVAEVAGECGDRGIRALAVITAGLTPAQEAVLLAAARRTGMRLAGPASAGVAVPGISLAATPAAHHPAPGHVGLAVQSGGVGAALLEQFSRLGIGISCFAALGGKLDVSGTDMLLWWDADRTTELAVLHLESFGNPRRFARTARRIGARVPVLTVHAGRSAPDQRAAFSHTAAAAAPLITRQALFEQAGIIATTSFAELLDAAVLMSFQPIPAGSAVAIVSAGGGAGELAADACADVGLAVAATSESARSRLRQVLPAAASVDGPVDTTAAVSPQAFTEALRITAADEGVAALIAMVVRNASADLLPALSAARLPVPVTAVMLDQPEAVRLLPGGDTVPAVPAYASPKRLPGRWPGPPATAPGGPGRPARCWSSPTCGLGRPARSSLPS